MSRARPPGMPTIKGRAFNLAQRYPGITAADASGLLGEKVVSTSWALTDLVRQGKLKRKAGVGRRGGWGYFPVQAARNSK